MESGGRSRNYGGVDAPQTRPSTVSGQSTGTRRSRRGTSNTNNDFREESHRLISDDEGHTELSEFLIPQAGAYFHDAGTDVELDYAASGIIFLRSHIHYTSIYSPTFLPFHLSNFLTF